MKAFFQLLIASTLALGACAQNDSKVINDANAQPRNVGGSFHAIAISHGIDLYLTQGDEEAVAVSANKDEYRDKIVTKVENGVLKVYYSEDWNFGFRSRKLRAYISVKTIDGLEASGGSDVIVKGILNADKLQFDMSGGSDFVGEVKANELTVDISGGSDVKVKGSVTNLKIDASGGSDFNGYDLLAEFAYVEASGGSDAQLNVSKELAADASGGSDIDYKGSPAIKHSSSSGGSSVTKRG